ncbi:hypothetical protein [uncultured Duncaniella sp.]|uniref:hypothetical protein n=1 Tax=uncultured Duncaniella sp. TaxID=2768039 RepID=UPI002613F16F|nr:hypothetical protein [uncultured Duncaniella sp.]
MSLQQTASVNEQTIQALITEIKTLRSELNDLRQGIQSAKIQLNPTSIYNNKEVRLILGVDERLIRKYRDYGYLTYHRQDDKYWYTGEDIIDFMKRTRYEAFA